MRDSKVPCQHCGKRRLLKTVYVEHLGETRQLDMCRSCHQAVKEAIRRGTAPEKIAA